ncbi:MAG: formimidoylglutamate deiminase [Gemmatimonadota bacterium]
MTIAPDLTYLDGKFERNVAIEFDDASGRITRVLRDAAPAGSQRLTGKALLPGFVNVHSHAFQRAIRGRTQWRPANAPPSDFWSWRETMYEAVLAMTPEDVFRVSRLCFTEMLKAGYTSVGEFHYLQRDQDGNRYNNPLELHEAVLSAAQDAGIRIVLINTAYATGGVLKPLRAPQRRFNTPELETFLAECDQLNALVRNKSNATMGIAPHSIRAVAREWLAPIHSWAERANVPLHMHVSEQTAEVEACIAAYGRRPVELLHEAGILDARLTAIHATHVAMNEIALLARARATVAACPTTERDLGDGFLQATSLHAAGAHVGIGTDSQTVIDPLEEIRLIEYHERLHRNERVLLTRTDGERAELAPTLLRYGTLGGARSLQLDAGEIANGKLADFVTIDLDHIQLAGWSEETLGPLLALSASAPAVVTDTWVGGKRVAGR